MSSPVHSISAQGTESAPILSVVPGPADCAHAFDRLTSSVAVITVLDGARPTGLAIRSLSLMSTQPPLVSFTIPLVSSRWPALVHADHIGVHLLSSTQSGLAESFAPHRSGGFTGSAGEWCPGSYGVPVLSGCATSAIALIEQRIHSGDGAVIVARILEATTRPGTRPLVTTNA